MDHRIPVTLGVFLTIGSSAALADRAEVSGSWTEHHVLQFSRDSQQGGSESSLRGATVAEVTSGGELAPAYSALVDRVVLDRWLPVGFDSYASGYARGGRTSVDGMRLADGSVGLNPARLDSRATFEGRESRRHFTSRAVTRDGGLALAGDASAGSLPLASEDWVSFSAMQPEDGDMDEAVDRAWDAAGAEDGVENVDEPAEYNDGQDPTRPLWRLDLRTRYVQLSGDAESVVQTFRIDAPLYLDGGKKGLFYTRVDAPLVYTDQRGTDNPDGDYEVRFGDMLVQNIYLPPFDWVQENTFADAMALGVQWGLPTGGNDFVSTEKLAIAGVFAWKNNIIDDSGSSFFAPVWRYRVDIADVSNGENRESINEFSVQPIVNISTAKWGWPIDFITFYETQEIRLNLTDEENKRSGDVFIPFEVEFGKLWNDNSIVTSIDFATPIYKSDGFDAYDWFIEFRVGFFF